MLESCSSNFALLKLIIVTNLYLTTPGDEKWRIVIDFRLLNEKTTGDANPLPNTSEILNHLGKAQYFSVFDLSSGFLQI